MPAAISHRAPVMHVEYVVAPAAAGAAPAVELAPGACYETPAPVGVTLPRRHGGRQQGGKQRADHGSMRSSVAQPLPVRQIVDDLIAGRLPAVADGYPIALCAEGVDPGALRW